MAKRKRRRKHAVRRKSSGSKAIRNLLAIAGLGFGIYMVMKSYKPGIEGRPPVATVDGRQIPMQILTDADLQKWST